MRQSAKDEEWSVVRARLSENEEVEKRKWTVAVYCLKGTGEEQYVRLLAGTRVRARFLCQKRGYLFNFHREKNLGKLLIEFFISKFFGTLLTSTVPTKGSGQYSTHKRFLVLLTLYYRVLGYFSYTHEEL
jgi:hypothetical protein